MDNFYGLDRADRWLNSRLGQQRSVLNWFQVFIMGWYLGILGWLAWSFFASVPLIALPVIALVAAVLAVPLRRLAPAMHARRARRHPAKTGPEFTWRWIVTAILFGIEEALVAVNGSLGQNLAHHALRGALDLLQVIVALSVFPLLITTPRYTRRYLQARQGGPVGLPARPVSWPLPCVGFPGPKRSFSAARASTRSSWSTNWPARSSSSPPRHPRPQPLTRPPPGPFRRTINAPPTAPADSALAALITAPPHSPQRIKCAFGLLVSRWTAGLYP